jgi:phosphatidylinositol glycan class B
LLPILPLICILAGHVSCRLVHAVDYAASKGYGANGAKVVLSLFVLSNYPQLLYLGVIHQRGPIAVNEYLSYAIKEGEERQRSKAATNDIAGAAKIGIRQSDGNEIREYSIHYLTSCHSAPLYSHLHIPNVRVNAWHLDCSADCRSQQSKFCESDAFLNDPLRFVMSAYGHSVDGGCIEDAMVRPPPTFLVVMQDDAEVIGSVLMEKLEMSHVASIRHTVKSLSWKGSPYNANCTYGRCHDVATLFSTIDVHFDHFEIYRSLLHD